MLEAENLSQVSELLASAAHATGQQIASIDLRRFNRVIDYAPEDMTVTAEAGLTLEALQATLATQGQWLPIDAPQPERTTLGAILASNSSGPRRLGYGTVRDWVIGMRVMLANGTIIKSGGKVVKNVTGYDLAKLFIGSRGTLGVIVEATFKLRPLPEREVFVQRTFARLDDAMGMVETVAASKLNPVVIDLHNLSLGGVSSSTPFHVVLGLAGTREDVAEELELAAALGLREAADLGHEPHFWSDPSAGPVHRRSVLPSNLGETLRELGEVLFVARAGNGIVHYRGAPPPSPSDSPRRLSERLKAAFDPKHIFPDLPA